MFVELFVLAKIMDEIRGCEVNVVIPLKVDVELAVPKVKDPPDKLEPIVIAEVAPEGCITFTYIVDTLKTDAFALFIVFIAFVTYPLTHAVVGTLDELSELDKDAFIFGFIKKVAVDAFKIEVFVILACTVPIIAVDAFNREVFVFETKTLFINLFTHEVVGILEELSVVASDAFIIGLNKKVAVDAFKIDTFPVVACTVPIIAVDAFNIEVFVFDENTLFINLFTHAVVGILEELSVVASDAFMVGLNKKVAVETFSTDVFVVVDCRLVIVPVVDCKVVTVPEMACMFDTFSTDTFPVVACTVPMVPVVDCKVVTVPEVDCRLIKEPVDTFKTDVFVVVDCRLVIVPFVDCRVVTTPEVACRLFMVAVEALKTDTCPVLDCRLVIVPFVDCIVVTVPEVACRLLMVAVEALKTDTFPVLD